jgi:hypothetical protein
VTGGLDLSEAKWAVLELLLPDAKKPGWPPKWTKRQLVDGIRWRIRLRHRCGPGLASTPVTGVLRIVRRLAGPVLSGWTRPPAQAGQRSPAGG